MRQGQAGRKAQGGQGGEGAVRRDPRSLVSPEGASIGERESSRDSATVGTAKAQGTTPPEVVVRGVEGVGSNQ